MLPREFPPTSGRWSLVACVAPADEGGVIQFVVSYPMGNVRESEGKLREPRPPTPPTPPTRESTVPPWLLASYPSMASLAATYCSLPTLSWRRLIRDTHRAQISCFAAADGASPALSAPPVEVVPMLIRGRTLGRRRRARPRFGEPAWSAAGSDQPCVGHADIPSVP